jgi:hypothetical protein
MALCFWFLLALSQFSHFFFRISNLFSLSITAETYLVEMRIWCIKIGIAFVLHPNCPVLGEGAITSYFDVLG